VRERGYRRAANRKEVRSGGEQVRRRARMNSAISLSIAPSFAALDTHIGVGTENLNSENANIVRYLQRKKITKRESAGAYFCVREQRTSVRQRSGKSA
jgi:hypothetical protein